MDDYPTLQIKALRKASDLEEYKLYRAALEWSLVDPIVIESRDDLNQKTNGVIELSLIVTR